MQVDSTKSAGQQWMAIQAPTNPAERQVREPELIQAVSAVNEAALFGQQYELKFDTDGPSHRTLLRLVDRETHEVVRQVPPEYVLRLARQMAKRNG